MAAEIGRVTMGGAKPAVESSVRVTPAKRNVTLRVPLDDMAHLSRKRAIAKINRTEISLTLEPYSGTYIPKTLAAVDALLVLLAAVRDELVEQGVES